MTVYSCWYQQRAGGGDGIGSLYGIGDLSEELILPVDIRANGIFVSFDPVFAQPGIVPWDFPQTNTNTCRFGVEKDCSIVDSSTYCGAKVGKNIEIN